MTNSEVLAVLEKIEKETNITSLTLSKWSIWGIIRTQLAFFLRDSVGKPSKAEKKIWTKFNRWECLKRIILWKWLSIFIKKELRNKILVFTNSVNRRDKINGHDKDVVFDDYIAALGRERFVVLERGIPYGLRPSFFSDFYYEDFLLVMAFFYLLSYVTILPRTKKRYLFDLAFIYARSFPYGNAIYHQVDKKLYRWLRLFWAEKHTYRLILWFLKVKGALLSCSYGNEAFSAACREAKIKAVEFQHGIISPFHFGYIYGKHLISVKNSFPVPNVILTYGRYWSRILLEKSFRAPGEVIEVGNPRIDFWKCAITPEAQGNKSMLITSQGVIALELISFCRAIAEILAKEEIDFRLVIKPHFNEITTVPLWEELEKTYPSHIKVEDRRAPNLFTLLSQSSFHGSVFSTVHYEAISLRKFTCIFKLPGWTDVADLLEKKAAILLETPHECADLIKKILASSYYSLRTEVDILKISREYQEPDAIQNGITTIKRLFRSVFTE